MEFLCLICAEKLIDDMPAAEAVSHAAEYLQLMQRLQEGGHYVESRRLLPAKAAVTLRVRNEKVSVTDGPFAETKEQLGGFFILKAADIEEAIRLAAEIPGAKIGCVEIRPIAEVFAPLS